MAPQDMYQTPMEETDDSNIPAPTTPPAWLPTRDEIKGGLATVVEDRNHRGHSNDNADSGKDACDYQEATAMTAIPANPRAALSPSARRQRSPRLL